MKTFVPSYFKKFKCIAGACPDSCCIGWEADLDGEILKKYKTVGGELGERIKNALTKDETDCDIFTLCDNGRCPFLNSKNLCDIQATHGEEYLSKTCAMFPRFFDSFCDITEMGLGFGCPEAARIMFEDDEPFSLTVIDYNGHDDEFDSFDNILTEEIIGMRDVLFTILESKNLSFKEKISLIVKETIGFQLRFQEEKVYDDTAFGNSDFVLFVQTLKNMEYISAKRKRFIENLEDSEKAKDMFVTYQKDFENLLKYYLYRYMLAYGFSGDVITPLKLGLFACVVISRVYASIPDLDKDARIKIMYSYSKEVEYSDVNMQILDDVTYRCISLNDLLNMI